MNKRFALINLLFQIMSKFAF